ncbi:helix-turn-helix domain-containing protein [Sphaerisporangium sp. NPDC049003]|uniref:helix-turn-helix domain-containing protein n=1 Tax=Sphaerisporangium sp. NPDC049003 TaxID=3364517 RepID=UPI00371A2AB1
MTQGHGPTVRRRRLASELRKLRERSGLTGDQAAEALGWSPSKISRIETCRVGVTAKDLARALDLYKVTDGKREALLTLARTSKQRGWWDRYDSIRTDYANYISLEAEASSVMCYCNMLIHGLLQTEDYARAVIRSALMSLLPPAEIDRRVEVRMTRQEALRRESPLKIWAVLDEAVLNRMTGGEKTMREQGRHLLEQAELPNVTIQVLPNALGAHPGTVEFSILEFPEPYDPDAVYVETMTSSLYVEDDMDVYRYTLAFDQLRAMALGPDESIKMIRRVVGTT